MPSGHLRNRLITFRCYRDAVGSADIRQRRPRKLWLGPRSAATLPAEGWLHLLCHTCGEREARAMPSSPMRFECRNCNARYQLIRTKAGPKTIDRQVSCSECGAPFHSRAEGAVLRYRRVDSSNVQPLRVR